MHTHTHTHTNTHAYTYTHTNAHIHGVDLHRIDYKKPGARWPKASQYLVKITL